MGVVHYTGRGSVEAQPTSGPQDLGPQTRNGSDQEVRRRGGAIGSRAQHMDASGHVRVTAARSQRWQVTPAPEGLGDVDGRFDIENDEGGVVLHQEPDEEAGAGGAPPLPRLRAEHTTIDRGDRPGRAQPALGQLLRHYLPQAGDEAICGSKKRSMGHQDIRRERPGRSSSPGRPPPLRALGSSKKTLVKAPSRSVRRGELAANDTRPPADRTTPPPVG